MNAFVTELKNKFAALDPAQMSADQPHSRFGHEVLKPAAVLVPLVDHSTNEQINYNVLLTRRASHLKHHAGQISFPGGRFEQQDLHLQQTALRETHEEIGIPHSDVEIIGTLPQHETITGYMITPYVGWLKADYSLTVDAGEVAEVFEVPLSFICDPQNQRIETRQFEGREVNFYVIEYNDYWIWGATARILVEFAKIYNSLDQF